MRPFFSLHKNTKKWNILRALSLTMLLLCLFDILVQIIFTLLPDQRFKMLTYTTDSFSDTELAVELWAGVGLNFCVVVAGIVALVLMMRALTITDHKPLFLSLGLKAASVIALTINLSSPGRPYAVAWFFVMFGLIIPQLGLLGYFIFVLARARRGQTKKPLLRYLSSKASDLKAVFDRVSAYMTLREVRAKYNHQFVVSRSILAIAAGLLLCISTGTFIFELKKIFSTQDSFFGSDILAVMNEEAATQWGPQRKNNGTRVVVVILDGLRLDYVGTNDNLRALRDDPDFVKDSVFMTAGNGMPTMSVPNWLTILSGTPPEQSGVLGNLLVPETQLDTMFAEAKRFGINRGMTASPWMSALVKGQLPLLHGDGTIATDYGQNPPAKNPTADPADWIRGIDIATEGMTDWPTYELFLVHLSDIDVQGHASGVIPKYNKFDTYNGAVTNKTSIVRHLLNITDSNTVIVLTSDHGQVDRGGHGGIHPVLRTVPLWIYKKGSGLNATRYTGAHHSYDDGRVRLMDIAPTFCAILGIPVPRQTIGHFLPDAMRFFNQSTILDHWKDLFYQRRTFTRFFLEQTSGAHLDDAVFNMGYDTGFAEADYLDALYTLDDIWMTERASYVSWQITRNILLTIAIDILILAALLFILQSHTFCTPLNIVAQPSPEQEKQRLKQAFPAMSDDKVMAVLPERMKLWNLQRHRNRVAAAYGLGSVAVYYGITILVFWILYWGYGYDIWDSTLVHTPEVLARYLAYSLLPGFVIAFVTSRIYNIVNTRPRISKDDSLWRRIYRRIGWFSIGAYSELANHAMVYLVRFYVMLFILIAQLVLFVLEGTFTFIVPGVFRVLLIDAENWGYRFRVLTVIFMSFPLVLTSVLELIFWHKFKENSSVFDSVFLLKIFKRVLSNPEVTVYAHEKELLECTALTSHFEEMEHFVEVCVDEVKPESTHPLLAGGQPTSSMEDGFPGAWDGNHDDGLLGFIFTRNKLAKADVEGGVPPVAGAGAGASAVATAAVPGAAAVGGAAPSATPMITQVVVAPPEPRPSATVTPV